MDIVCSTKIQPTFTSKNLFTREIDTIARRVHLEYPTLSNTALKRFSVKDKTKQNQQFLTFISAYINKLRNYYTNSNSKIERIIKIIKGVEKTKIANCNEQAILTAIALKLNGYKNIQLYSIHAYNKDTGIIKNMDHLVVGINIKKPKDYIEGNCTPRKYRNTCLSQAMTELNMVDSMGIGISQIYKTQA